MAEGATVVTHEMNKPYFQKVWANPHTLSPDLLAKNPKKPAFKTVKEKLVLTDGNHVIELDHMQDFLHNDGMLLACLPKEKVLVEADAYNPPPQPPAKAPATISPYNASLAANIDRLKLDVQRIVPIHYAADNRQVKMPELLTALGKANNQCSVREITRQRLSSSFSVSDGCSLAGSAPAYGGSGRVSPGSTRQSPSKRRVGGSHSRH